MVNSDDNSFETILKEKGLRVTKQRVSVLEVLEENMSQHLTAEEIYVKVKEKSPEIGLATVYRTIQLLYELKLINKLELNDGFIRYEIGVLDEGKHHHHHLICEVCGSVTEAEDDLLDLIEDTCSSKYNFKVNDHIVKFYGVCNKCNQLENEN